MQSESGRPIWTPQLLTLMLEKLKAGRDMSPEDYPKAHDDIIMAAENVGGLKGIPLPPFSL